MKRRSVIDIDRTRIIVTSLPNKRTRVGVFFLEDDSSPPDFENGEGYYNYFIATPRQLAKLLSALHGFHTEIWTQEELEK